MSFGFLGPLGLVFIQSFSSAAPLKVVIDPGHGGTDAGAVYGPAKEADISLKVARHLKTLLEASPFFSPVLTREADQNMSLQDRVQISEREAADLFLSIHANASPDKRARGVEFYFQNHLPPDEEALFLADLENQIVRETANADPTLAKKSDVIAIVEDLKRQSKMRNSFALSEKLLQSWGGHQGHVIRQAPFYVISKTSTPAVLIELGFISNPQESRKLIRSDHQKEIAQRIFQGLLGYKEMVDKTESARLK